MITSTELFNNAELALAAYAILPEVVSPLPTSSFKDKFIAAGMTDTEFDKFAFRYTDIIAVMPNQESTGFAATVFREAGTNKLTVAIRGTEGLTDLNDLLGADFGEIWGHGAAYRQIVVSRPKLTHCSRTKLTHPLALQYS